MCNSNEYRKRVIEKSRRKKKNQEQLAQLTKSEICYQIGINNPVTTFKQMATSFFLFSFQKNWQRSKLRSLPVFADGIYPAHVC